MDIEVKSISTNDIINALEKRVENLDEEIEKIEKQITELQKDLTIFKSKRNKNAEALMSIKRIFRS